MKKNILNLIACVLFSGSTLLAAGGGDLVNNGGGISEKNILFAYQRLGLYLKMCLNSDLCKIDRSQRSILEKIAKGLPQEQKAPNQIQFASEKKQTGFFIIDEEVKIAKTGSQIGSPIYINTDLIYSKNEAGFYLPTSVPEAVAILVHELGHHYGDYSHTDLDLLGVRVAMMLQLKTYTTPLLPWSYQISAMVVNADFNDSNPDILLYVENEAVDISDAFQRAVFCPKFMIPIPILPIPDINVATSQPLSSIAHNVHWKEIESKDSNGVKLVISADLSHKCKHSDDTLTRNQDYRMEVTFRVLKNKKGQWTLDRNSIRLEQKRDPWWKIIKFGT